MELILTPEQEEYLNHNGPFTAKELQDAYTKSVKEQQKLLRDAAKIRAKQL